MEPKWQRISFMPATPLGEDGRRVTGSAAHIALSRRAAAEGMVLLKNENETLPLKRGSRVAVFGKAQADYVKGGGGSGDTTVAYVRSLAQGLRMKQDEGKIEIFEPLERFYAENVKAQYAAGATPGKTREPILDDALVRQARAFTDTAVITICRFSGEDYDRTGQPHDGDYFLSFEEEHMVKKVLAAFPRVELHRERDVSLGRILREKVERLEHETEMQPLMPQMLLLLGCGVVRVEERLVIDEYAPGIRLLQKIEAAQQRRFAAAGGADDGDHLAGGERKADVAEYFCAAELLC